jgi:hypothetical protein
MCDTAKIGSQLFIIRFYQMCITLGFGNERLCLSRIWTSWVARHVSHTYIDTYIHTYIHIHILNTYIHTYIYMAAQAHTLDLRKHNSVVNNLASGTAADPFRHHIQINVENGQARAEEPEHSHCGAQDV